MSSLLAFGLIAQAALKVPIMACEMIAVVNATLKAGIAAAFPVAGGGADYAVTLTGTAAVVAIAVAGLAALGPERMAFVSVLGGQGSVSGVSHAFRTAYWNRPAS